MIGADIDLLIWALAGMFISFIAAILVLAIISLLDERDSVWVKFFLWASMIPFVSGFIFFSIMFLSGIAKWIQG